MKFSDVSAIILAMVVKFFTYSQFIVCILIILSLKLRLFIIHSKRTISRSTSNKLRFRYCCRCNTLTA